MDTTTQAYILGKLDSIREAQLLSTQRIEDRLASITTALAELASRPVAAKAAEKRGARLNLLSRLQNLTPFWQSMAAGGIFWIFGICTRSYLNNGGDPAALIVAIVKTLL